MIALHLEANLKTVEQVGTTPYLGTRVETEGQTTVLSALNRSRASCEDS